MIIAIRTAGIQSGKQAAAVAWAVSVAAHINALLPGTKVRVTRAVGGPIAEVHWMSEYASLAEFETVWAKIEGDAGFQALLKEARDEDLFDPRTLRDEIHQTVA